MLNPDNTVEKSIIHITAETELDKNITEADLIINWVKPKIEIKNNPNNGIINYAINNTIEYNLTFDITSEKSVDYDFKPDWSKCTYEIQNWDSILNNKITYEYTNGSFYIAGILNEIIETEFKLIIKYPFAENKELTIKLNTEVTEPIKCQIDSCTSTDTPMFTCENCGRHYCKEHGYCGCSICNKTFSLCTDCYNENHQQKCTVCNSIYCYAIGHPKNVCCPTICGPKTTCSECNETYCSNHDKHECKVKTKCDICGSTYYSTDGHPKDICCTVVCGDKTTCSECNKTYCSNHGGHPNVCCPTICGPKTTCECGHKWCSIHDEDHFITCNNCGLSYCPNEDHLITCDKCKNKYCPDEGHPDVCCESLCGPKTTCPDCGASRCSTHDNSHLITCNECESKYCPTKGHPNVCCTAICGDKTTCSECGAKYCSNHGGHPKNVCCSINCGTKSICSECGAEYCPNHGGHPSGCCQSRR